MHKITHFVELIEHGTKVKVGLDEKMLGAFPLVPLSFTTPTNSELCFTPMEHTMPPIVDRGGATGEWANGRQIKCQL